MAKKNVLKNSYLWPKYGKRYACKWQLACLRDRDNDFRDGAGCFGNSDGVPPSEVSEMEIVMYIFKFTHLHFQPHFSNTIKIISKKHFAGSNLGWNSKPRVVK